MADPWHAQQGTMDLCSEDIAWLLEQASVYADLGAAYASLGDEADLAYSLWNLFAYTKAVVGVVHDLKEFQRQRSSGHA